MVATTLAIRIRFPFGATATTFVCFRGACFLTPRVFDNFFFFAFSFFAFTVFAFTFFCSRTFFLYRFVHVRSSAAFTSAASVLCRTKVFRPHVYIQTSKSSDFGPGDLIFSFFLISQVRTSRAKSSPPEPSPHLKKVTFW